MGAGRETQKRDEMVEKGFLVETKFKEWLDRHRIPYWHISQEYETFSRALLDYMTKRPDFMILIPEFGFFLVDAEYKNPHPGFKTFVIDVEETVKYSGLQRYFNLRVWYVFSSDRYHFKTWFWIPVSRVLEIGKTEKRFSRETGREFFAIPMDEFVQVADSDNLTRLLTQFLSRR